MRNTILYSKSLSLKFRIILLKGNFKIEKFIKVQEETMKVEEEIVKKTITVAHI